GPGARGGARAGTGRRRPRPPDQPGYPEVRMRKMGFAALLVSIVALAGCGYALVGRSSNLPADVRSVYIKPLENKTPRTQAEQFLTRAIADEMVTRHRFAVVGSETGADAEL